MDMQLSLPTPNPGDWLSREGAAELLGIHAASLYRMVADGRVREYRPAGLAASPMFWRPEVEAFRDARTTARAGVR